MIFGMRSIRMFLQLDPTTVVLINEQVMSENSNEYKCLNRLDTPIVKIYFKADCHHHCIIHFNFIIWLVEFYSFPIY